MARWIVGFNRDRDSYQVPLAFAEKGELDTLVTDYYRGSSFPPISALRHRYQKGIDPKRVKTSGSALLQQLSYEVRRRRNSLLDFPSEGVDAAIGRLVSRCASRSDSGLLLYTGYALEAFEKFDDRPRLLFQYHPTAKLIEEAMALDEGKAWGEFISEPDLRRPSQERRFQHERQLADGIVCASSFTAQSLRNEGYDPARVKVVPYGGSSGFSGLKRSISAPQTFLFVGQGVQRKGLHLLLRAWENLAPKDAHLRIIASRMDPAIAKLVPDMPSVHVSGAVSSDELTRAMQDADTLVLPSLVEGFGLVVQEALAEGCRVIASAHTGASDLGLPEDVVRVISPGKVEPIMDALRDFILTAGDALAAAPQFEVKLRTWADFREGVRRAVGDLAALG